MSRLGPGGFRYLLALTVVLFHATRWVPIGHTAVYLFFVLSGYWMSRMYALTYARAAVPWRVYLVSRAWRIFPLYWCALAVTVGALATYAACTGKSAGEALAWVHDPEVLVRNAVLFELNDFDRRLIVPAWSLDLELQFYLLLPVIVALRARFGATVLAPLSLLSVVGAAATAVAQVYAYVLPPLIFFVIGIALDRGAARGPWCSQRGVRIASLLAAALYALPYVWRGYGQPIFYDRELSVLGAGVWEMHNVALAFLLVPFVDHNVRVASSARDRALGGLSYALYLSHWGALQLYAASFGAAPAPIKALGFCGYVIGSAIVAWLLYRGIDRPSEALRKRWLEQQLVR